MRVVVGRDGNVGGANRVIEESGGDTTRPNRVKNKGERAEVRGSAWEYVGVRGEFCVSGFETVERVLRVGGWGEEETREEDREKSVGGG